MTEYQIKLAKLYAELIGIDALDHMGGLLYPNDQGYMFENGVTCDWFNPFKSQLQLDARDNFEVNINNWSAQKSSVVSLIGYTLECEKINICTAVIECILKSKGKL